MPTAGCLWFVRRFCGAPFHACAGRFLVRKTSAEQQKDGKMFILSVCYKGKPTHHMVTKDEQTGGLKINNKAYGTTKTIKAVGLTLLTDFPRPLPRPPPPSRSNFTPAP